MHIKGDVPRLVTTDKDRFKQLIINLLGNALKYTLRGFIKLTVEVYEEECRKFFRVHVQDSGIGVKEERIGQLFDMFSRDEEGAKIDKSGLGLGLTICKTIVEQFDGKISAQSVYGQGSTFTFTFGYEDEEPKEQK